MYSRILVPVDLDNVTSLGKALDVAAQTAKENNATLVYTSVVDAIPTMSPKTEGEKLAERLSAFAAEQGKASGTQVAEHVTMRGDLHMNLGKDIIATAKEDNCDLIVMASHVPGIKEHILASHAGYVASHAPMSVYVVR